MPPPRKKLASRGKTIPQAGPSTSRASPGGSSITARRKTVLLRCSHCGDQFNSREALVQHKKDEHADRMTVLGSEYGSRGAPSTTGQDFAVPEDPPGPSKRRRPGTRDDGDNDPPAGRSSPKRGRKQGQNKGPLPIGRRVTVTRDDGSEEEEVMRNPKHHGA